MCICVCVYTYIYIYMIIHVAKDSSSQAKKHCSDSIGPQLTCRLERGFLKRITHGLKFIGPCFIVTR